MRELLWICGINREGTVCREKKNGALIFFNFPLSYTCHTHTYSLKFMGITTLRDQEKLPHTHTQLWLLGLTHIHRCEHCLFQRQIGRDWRRAGQTSCSASWSLPSVRLELILSHDSPKSSLPESHLLFLSQPIKYCNKRANSLTQCS